MGGGRERAQIEDSAFVCGLGGSVGATPRRRQTRRMPAAKRAIRLVYNYKFAFLLWSDKKMIRFLQTQGPTKKIILSGILLVICGAMIITFIPGGLTSELTGTARPRHRDCQSGRLRHYGRRGSRNRSCRWRNNRCHSAMAKWRRSSCLSSFSRRRSGRSSS